MFDHIIPQITKFSIAYKNPETRNKLINTFYHDIENDTKKLSIFQTKNIREIYKFISEIIRSQPTIIILIDEKTKELEEVCKSLPFEGEVIEFKTFKKEGVGLRDHIHLFEPLKKEGITALPQELHPSINSQSPAWKVILVILKEENRYMTIKEIVEKAEKTQAAKKWKKTEWAIKSVLFKPNSKYVGKLFIKNNEGLWGLAE